MPQLDGLRAVAVIVVLGFHLELAGFSGGYLGVSLFFTLSGYLITRLLLDEVARTGTINYSRYIARRMRRLLPAATIGLIGVTIGLLAGWFGPSDTARAGVVAAAAQVYNWFELASGGSYAELFQAPSPVAHYWSLSIEEQFYWIWPVVLLVAARRARRGDRPVVPAIAKAVWVSLGICLVATVLTAIWGSADAVYLATWARAPEILIGAVLALVAHRGNTLARLGRLQTPLLAAVLLAVVVTPTGQGWAYQGGLPLFAVLSAALIASLQNGGIVTRVLSLRPAVHIGRVSYGLYVYHWPLFLILTPQRLGFDGFGLVVVRLAVTYVLALASMVALELPIRLHTFRIGPRWQVTTGATLTLLILGIVTAILPAESSPKAAPTVIGSAAAGNNMSNAAAKLAALNDGEPGADGPRSAPPTDATSGDSATDTGSAQGGVPSKASKRDAGPVPSTSTVSTVATTTTTTVPPTPLIAFFGDSVGAWMLRDAAPSFARTDVSILNGTVEGCDGYAVATETRSRSGKVLPVLDNCTPWTTAFPALLASAPTPPTAAVLMVGQTASLDHRIDGAWLGPCESLEWYTDDLSERIDWLESRGIEVTLALPAHPGERAIFIEPDDYWIRFDCVRAAMSSLAVDKGVAVIDLDPLFCFAGDCNATREDGVHLNAEFAPIALDFILDEMMSPSAG